MTRGGSIGKGPRRSAGGSPWFPLVFFGTVALLFLQFYAPPATLAVGPFGRDGGSMRLPDARPAPNAYGRSGGVTMMFALPADSVEFPLEVYGDPTSLHYQWVRLSDQSPVDSARALAGTHVLAPNEPGFYQLALTRGEGSRVLPGLTLAVKVPFAQKTGTTLNGYRIGTYVAEQRGAVDSYRPDGFVEVAASDVDIQLSTHLRLGDFVTHDNQKVWPRYSAVDPRILDKMELVIAEIERLREGSAAGLALDVRSAFRTPLYNRQSSHAKDSRHQYGDAIDLSIDADGDGRINSRDIRLITAAVDSVEARHPELVGGFGVYSGILYRVPYVHIDARGTRVRWRG